MEKKSHENKESHIMYHMSTNESGEELVKNKIISMCKMKLHERGEKNHINGLRISDYSLMWMM